MKSFRKIAAPLFAAMVLASCSGGSDAAKGELVAALEELERTGDLTMTLSLDSTTDSLVAASSAWGDKLDPAEAEQILDSSLTISGAEGDTPEDAVFQVLLVIAGADAAELRLVEGDLYARADVDSVAPLAGLDPAAADAFAARASRQPGLEFVKSLIEGDWIVVRDVRDLAAAGGSAPGAQQQEELAEELERAVRENATVSEEGEDDAGTRYVATLPLRDTYERLYAQISENPLSVPGFGPPDPSDVPDRDATAEFWIRDGRLTQMRIDLTQFEAEGQASEGVDELALLVELADFDGALEAPSGAVEADPEKAFGSLFAGSDAFGDSGESNLPEGVDCSQLEGAPPEVIELYAEECPELQKDR